MSSSSTPSFSAFQTLSLEAVQQQWQDQREPQSDLKHESLDIFTSLPDHFSSFSPDDYNAFFNNGWSSSSIDYSSGCSPASPITTTAHNPYIVSDVSCDTNLDPLDQACSVVKSRSEPGRNLFENTEPGVTNNPIFLAMATCRPLAIPALSDHLSYQQVDPSDNLEDGLDAINQEQADCLHSLVSSEIITMSTSDGHRPGRESSKASHNQTFTSKSPKRQRWQKREHSHQKGERTVHTLIERRYRANLNSKMLALRDSLPSMRVAKRKAGERHKDDISIDCDSVSLPADTSNDLSDLAPAQKLSKAAILHKAIEYITDLEHHIQQLVRENQTLRAEVNEQLRYNGHMCYVEQLSLGLDNGGA